MTFKPDAKPESIKRRRHRAENRRPTPTQYDVIRRLLCTGGTIEYRRGGFWTFPGAKVAHTSQDTGDVPEWWVTSQTIKAMEAAGWLERTARLPAPADAWRDDRRLTEAARDLDLPAPTQGPAPLDRRRLWKSPKIWAEQRKQHKPAQS